MGFDWEDILGDDVDLAEAYDSLVGDDMDREQRERERREAFERMEAERRRPSDCPGDTPKPHEETYPSFDLSDPLGEPMAPGICMADDDLDDLDDGLGDFEDVPYHNDMDDAPEFDI